MIPKITKVWASWFPQEMQVVWNGLEFSKKFRQESGEKERGWTWSERNEAEKLGRCLQDPDVLITQAIKGL